MSRCTTPARSSTRSRRIVKVFALTAVAASVVTVLPQARANAVVSSQTFSFTQYVGSGTAPAGPYGTVTLTQAGSGVSVSVALAGTEGFVDTGAGHSLLWEMGNSPLSITSLTSGFSVVGGSLSGSTWTVSSADNGLHSGGAGYWDYAITCAGTAGDAGDAGAACGTGGSRPYTGNLDFTVANATLGDFLANGQGFYFASDICTAVLDGRCAPGGLTGNIAAGQRTTVPEPGTLALFAAGLLGCGLFLRRRARQSEPRG